MFKSCNIRSHLKKSLCSNMFIFMIINRYARKIIYSEGVAIRYFSCIFPPALKHHGWADCLIPALDDP